MIRKERENGRRGGRLWDWLPYVVKRYIYPKEEDIDATPVEKKYTEETKTATTKEKPKVKALTIPKTQQPPIVVNPKSVTKFEGNVATKDTTRYDTNFENFRIHANVEKKSGEVDVSSDISETISSISRENQAENSFRVDTEKKKRNFSENVEKKATKNVSAFDIKVEPKGNQESIQTTTAENNSNEDDINDDDLAQFKRKIQNDDTYLKVAVTVVKFLGHKIVDVGVDTAAKAVKGVQSTYRKIKSFFD